MRKNQTGFGLMPVLGALLIVFIIGFAGALVYQANYRFRGNKSAQTHDSRTIMTVGWSGGLCADGPCNDTRSSLYDSGEFEGYTSLDASEVSELKAIIDAIDFASYERKLDPQCASFVDGQDQVLQFPQKYGDRKFVACTLDIPGNDKAFSYINDLLASHRIKR